VLTAVDENIINFHCKQSSSSRRYVALCEPGVFSRYSSFAACKGKLTLRMSQELPGETFFLLRPGVAQPCTAQNYPTQ